MLIYTDTRAVNGFNAWHKRNQELTAGKFRQNELYRVKCFLWHKRGYLVAEWLALRTPLRTAWDLIPPLSHGSLPVSGTSKTYASRFSVRISRVLVASQRVSSTTRELRLTRPQLLEAGRGTWLKIEQHCEHYHESNQCFPILSKPSKNNINIGSVTQLSTLSRIQYSSHFKCYFLMDSLTLSKSFVRYLLIL